MGENKKVNAFFKSLSNSHKKAYIQWIESAKKDETREKRAEKMIEMLSTSQTLK
ncbi:MAG: hypothetical protein E6K96_03895 [Thaumarchaeota archaeon]|nr:MAG: hypothetical protein E6K96_03895 [Nitrososphaerota archaeon]